MRNGIVLTVTTETEGMRGIGSDRAVRRRSVTGRGDTERKRKGGTSHRGGTIPGLEINGSLGKKWHKKLIKMPTNFEMGQYFLLLSANQSM